MASENDGPLDAATPALDTAVIQSVEAIEIVAAEIPGHEVEPTPLPLTASGRTLDPVCAGDPCGIR